MKTAAAAMKVSEARNCHGGTGTLVCREVHGDYACPDAGIKYVHDDVLPPGTSIGEHRHDGDEEFYYILEGSGVMTLDDEIVAVQAGDFCFTKSGHRHNLRNTGTVPMRLMVVCAKN